MTDFQNYDNCIVRKSCDYTPTYLYVPDSAHVATRSDQSNHIVQVYSEYSSWLHFSVVHYLKVEQNDTQ